MRLIDRYIAQGLGWEDIAFVLRISKYDVRRRDQLKRYVLHQADHANKLRRSKNAKLVQAQWLRSEKNASTIGRSKRKTALDCRAFVRFARVRFFLIQQRRDGRQPIASIKRGADLMIQRMSAR